MRNLEGLKLGRGWNKGKTGIYSKETIQKIKEARKNQTFSLETRKKMSEAHKQAKCWNWQGGISPINKIVRASFEYKLWRKAIFERDNYVCIWCGDNKGGNLEADHIKPFALYPELRFAIDNGRTLCHDCHRTTETYGNKHSKGNF